MSSDIDALARVLRDLKQLFISEVRSRRTGDGTVSKSKKEGCTFDDLLARARALNAWIDDVRKAAGNGKMGSSSRYGQLERLRGEAKKLADDISWARETEGAGERFLTPPRSREVEVHSGDDGSDGDSDPGAPADTHMAESCRVEDEAVAREKLDAVSLLHKDLVALHTLTKDVLTLTAVSAIGVAASMWLVLS